MANLIDEYVEYASDSCDAPKLFHKAVGYWLVSTLIGRFATITTTYSAYIRPNIWVMLVGPSRIVRKTTAMELGESIVKEVDPDCLMPSYFSPEALIEILDVYKDKNGVAWVRDEMGGFFKELEKQYMFGTREIFSSIYSGHGLKRKLRKGEYVVPDGLYITVLSSLPTPSYSYLHEEDFTSGFLNRFLLIYRDRREKSIPVLNVNNTLQSMRKLLVEKFRNALTLNAGIPVSFRHDAAVEIDGYGDEVDRKIERIESDNPDSLWKLYLAETPKFLLKLSALRRLANVDNEYGLVVTVEKEDVLEAKKFLDEVLESANKLVSEVQSASRSRMVFSEQKALDRIMDIIRLEADNSGGISFSTLLAKTKFLKDDLIRYLETLVSSRRIVMIKGRSSEKGGRKPVYIFPIELEAKALLYGDAISPKILRD